MQDRHCLQRGPTLVTHPLKALLKLSYCYSCRTFIKSFSDPTIIYKIYLPSLGMMAYLSSHLQVSFRYLWSLSLTVGKEGHELLSKVFTRGEGFYLPSWTLPMAWITWLPKITVLSSKNTTHVHRHIHTQMTTEIHGSPRSLLDRVLCFIWPFVRDTEILEHKNCWISLSCLSNCRVETPAHYKLA